MDTSRARSRSRSGTRFESTRARSLSLQRRASGPRLPSPTPSSPNAPQGQGDPILTGEQFTTRRSPQRPSSNESIDLADHTEIAGFRKEMRALCDDVENMRESVAATKKELAKTMTDNTKLEILLDSKTAELKSAHHQYTERIKKLEDQIAEERNQNNSAQEALAASDSRVTELREELQGTRETAGDLQEQVAELAAKLEESSERTLFTATKRAFAEASSYQQELQEVADSYIKTNEANERKIARLTIELNELHSQYQELHDRYRKEMDKLKQFRDMYHTSTEDLRLLRSKSPTLSLAGFEKLSVEKQKPAMVASPGTAPNRQEVKAKQFPKSECHPTFTDYVTSLKSYVARLSERGYPEGPLAEELYQAVIQSKYASPFLHHYDRAVPKGSDPTIQSILECLESVDFEHVHLSPQQRFANVRKLPTESRNAFLQRVQQSFDSSFPLERHKERRFLEIKKRFIEGGDFPLYMQEKLLPYSNIKELIFGAESLAQQQNSRTDRRRFQPQRHDGTPAQQQGHAPQASNAPTAPQISNPFFTQAQFNQGRGAGNNGQGGGPSTGVAVATTPAQSPPQCKVYTLRDGSVSFRPPPRERVKAEPNARRAPLDAELNEATRFGWCGHCRQYNHPAVICHYEPFCIRCNIEGQHEDRRCPAKQVQQNRNQVTQFA